MSGGSLGLDLWTVLTAARVLVICLMMAGAALALFRLGDLLQRPALQAAAAGMAIVTIGSFGGFIAQTAVTQMIVRGVGGSGDYSFAFGGVALATGCASLLGWGMVSGGLIAAALTGKPRQS